jgi:hypothetical protein
LRADLAPQQASILDGIRISAEMPDVAYPRLTEHLWQFRNEEKQAAPVASLFLDGWAIVDSVHRLRHLLDQIAGLKKGGTKNQIFQRKTGAATTSRTIIQHLRND